MSAKPSNKSLSVDISSARKFAFFILQEYESGKFASDTINKYIGMSNLNTKDRKLAAELALNSIRHIGPLDEMISIYSSGKTKIQNPIRNILRMGFYQLKYMEKIPEFAAVNESVELAKEFFGKKPAGFVNAILRNYLRDPKRLSDWESKLDIIPQIAYRNSHPQWLIRRWLKFYSLRDVELLCSFNNIKAHLVLNINTSKISPSDFCELLDNNNIDYEKSPLHQNCVRLDSHNQVESLPGFAEGFFFVQDETPVLLIDKLDIFPGATILDACAAPGGKTSYAAQLTGKSGIITAIDVNESRLKLLENNISRLELKNITMKTCDSTNKSTLRNTLNRCEFDFIILDVPCSNTGVLRKRIEARWRLREHDFSRLSFIQKEMLTNISDFLKPEGKLLYSTCSIDPQENENVISDFLRDNPGFKLEEQYLFFPKSLQYSDGGFGAVIKRTGKNSDY